MVSGTTLKGVIRLNDTLMLGPDPLGHFQQIAVKSIHRKRMAVKEVRAGQTASFALKKVFFFLLFHYALFKSSSAFFFNIFFIFDDML